MKVTKEPYRKLQQLNVVVRTVLPVRKEVRTGACRRISGYKRLINEERSSDRISGRERIQ